MTLLEAKVEALLRDADLSVEEEPHWFKVYKLDKRDRFEHVPYLWLSIDKSKP